MLMLPPGSHALSLDTTIMMSTNAHSNAELRGFISDLRNLPGARKMWQRGSVRRCVWQSYVLYICLLHEDGASRKISMLSH